MKIQKYTPRGLSGAFIDHIALHDKSAVNDDQIITVLPDGMTELIIDYENQYERKIYINNKEGSICGSQLIGIKSFPHLVSFSEIDAGIAVRFKPGCLSFFTSIKMSEIRDLSVRAEDVFGKGIKVLENQIFRASDNSEKIIFIEAFFEELLKDRAQSNSVKEKIEKIYQTPGRTKLSDTLVENSYYKKTERDFQKNVGISPKLFSRIVRLNYALFLISRNSDRSLAEIACSAGYYDQAHFIKDFTRFTNRKPGEFSRNLTDIEQFNLTILSARFNYASPS